MKKILSIILGGFLFASCSVYAENHEGFIFGLKAGQINWGDLPSGFHTNDDPLKGGLIGINFQNGIAVEIEGMNGGGDFSYLGVSGQYDISSQAIYLAYRTSGDLYLKLKGGWMHETADASVANISVTDSGTNSSYGVGGGYRFGPASVEAEYTVIDSDNTSAITIGLNYFYY